MTAPLVKLPLHVAQCQKARRYNFLRLMSVYSREYKRNIHINFDCLSMINNKGYRADENSWNTVLLKQCKELLKEILSSPRDCDTEGSLRMNFTHGQY